MMIMMVLMIVLIRFVHRIYISEIFLVLVEEADGDRLDKGFVYVEIFPFLR